MEGCVRPQHSRGVFDRKRCAVSSMTAVVIRLAWPYLRHETRLVWVVHPQKKTIRIHRANGTVQDLRVADEPNGEEVIPGFSCPVSEVFRLPG